MNLETYREIISLNKEYKEYSEAIYLMQDGVVNLASKRTKITKDIMEKCDHTYPDGRTALESHFYHQCEICGAII